MQRPQSLLKLSAGIACVIAVVLVLVSLNLIELTAVPVSTRLYVLGMALLQGIFAIWFIKGAAEFEFARLGATARIAIGLAFALWAVHLRSAIELAYLNIWLARGLILYAAIEVLLGSAILTATSHSRIGGIAQRPLTLVYGNRLFFAIYMIALAGWIFLFPETFIAFFHLPQAATPAEAPLLNGLLAIFSLLLLQLALFNLIAVRYRIESLIAAGMRGGLVTCVAVGFMVGFGIAHPLVLLIPAVDLVSVGVIAVGKLRTRTSG